MVADLARRAAALLRAVDVDASAVPALAFVKRVRDQAGLSATARADNVRGSLVARRVPTTPVVLVDDIVTTGSTLVAAANRLAEGGVAVDYAAVIASTRRCGTSGVLHRT